MFNFVGLSGEGASNILSSEVVTFVVNGAKDIIGILTTPPLGVFLTIGILSAIVGLTGSIVAMVRRR